MQKKSSYDIEDVCRGILMAYFIVLTVIYPLYAPGGYTRIGEVKYELFRMVSLITMAAMSAAVLLSVIVRRDRNWVVTVYCKMSAADWFAYGYFMTVLLSYLCSPYKEDALWGVSGWHMGVVTQVIFIFLYFAFSRYYHCSIGWIGAWLAASAAVFVLGICNRYSVYPIVMEGSSEIFISTLGNINWFSGYWSVAASVGIALYWISDKIWVRVLSAVYCVAAMLSGVIQGSGSAYIVFGVLAAALFVLSLQSGRICRFLELCMLFAAGCLIGRWMCTLPFMQLNYLTEGSDSVSRIARALITGSAALWMLGAVCVIYVFVKLVQRGYIPMQRSMQKVITVVLVLVFAGMSIIWVAKGESGLLQIPIQKDGMQKNGVYHMVFDEDWGNGRGAAYNCGISAYIQKDGIHKAFGIGPDCFADCVYELPELADRLAEQFPNQRLTNAHNEWLTLLVNTGAVGLVCYIALFTAVFVRCLRRASKQPALYLCALSILAYTAHNVVSFQQVLNTPYIFVVMGIGECLYRRT